MVIVDTREKKNQFILDYFDKHGIEYKIQKLEVGDYQIEGSPHFVIDRKADIQELVKNIVHDHERLSKEIDKAIKGNIQLVFLIEDEEVKSLDDLKHWRNYRVKWSPRATQGETLLKQINTLIDHRDEKSKERYDRKYTLRFLFVDHDHYASRLLRLLEANDESMD